MTALSGLRILDLTDLKGAMSAKLFGDMGADVIKVEPPEGDAARRIGPFLDNKPHPERSLLFWFYNTSKRGITLDLNQPAGQELLKQLAAKADVLVESAVPGTLARLGLGYDELKRPQPESGAHLDYALWTDRAVCRLPLLGPGGRGSGRHDLDQRVSR